ncbi:exopolysaccharide biosynthesis protein [Amaricoccus tamworthensis]|uniref:exopolysaccharide biosynthesis protein n=1 Tax=Amaricoccus tamworthensis TaxID=57002 RepID=UPI003C7A7218
MGDELQQGEAIGPDDMHEVVHELRGATRGDETTLGDVLEELEHASFVPVLMAPALAVVSPLSGIPLFSSFCGLVIALVSAQMAMGRTSLWLPEWIKTRKIPSGRLKKAAEGLSKPAKWLDRHTHRRLDFLVAPPFDRVLVLTCMLCGMSMTLLEIVPFSSSILGAAVVLMSLTLLVRDGLLALAAYGFIGIGIAVVLQVIPG